MPRLTITLSKQEWDALRRSAERDLRGLREQARYLIVKGLTAELAAQANDGAPDPAQSVAVEGGSHDPQAA
jgi:hypothetical protein